MGLLVGSLLFLHFGKEDTLVKHVGWAGSELSFISDVFLPRAQQTQNQPEHSTCKTKLLDEGNQAKASFLTTSSPPACTRLPWTRMESSQEGPASPWAKHWRRPIEEALHLRHWLSVLALWMVSSDKVQGRYQCRGKVSKSSLFKCFTLPQYALEEFWNPRGEGVWSQHYSRSFLQDSSVQKADWLLIVQHMQCLY